MRLTYVDNSCFCTPMFVQCVVVINVPTKQPTAQKSWRGSLSHQLLQREKKKKKWLRFIALSSLFPCLRFALV